MKRVSLLVVVLIIMLATTVACSSSQNAQNEEEGAQTLTLATWHASDGMTKAIEGFNASQNKYRIEVKDYGEYDNLESY